ncbi:MAG: ribosome maturation factor RimP [Burkholderiaceae bacterium]
MALQQIVEQTVTGLGYDLVEIGRSAGGLLRITIDLHWRPLAPIEAQGQADLVNGERFISVEDCEKVTRQLQFALEVEGVEYTRLEVSSPGIDRLLRDARDFERFAGAVVDITLKAALGAAAQGMVNAKRKKFRGRLERAQPAQGAPTSWRIVWSDAPPLKPGQKVSKKRPPPQEQVLGFTLDEVREARLAPIVNFKGRAAVELAPTDPGPDESV